MNPNQDQGNHDPLDKALAQWRVDAPLPPRFQEQVWQRNAKAETRSKVVAARGLWRLIEVVLPRPRFAYAYLGVLLAFGVAAGSWAAQVKTSRMDSKLSLRYVQSIDPYRGDSSQP